MAKEYIWIPIDEEQEERSLRLFLKDTLYAVFTIRPAVGSVKWYASLPLPEGCRIETEGFPYEIKDTPAPRVGENRPLLHFTPPFGWINDPNGLIFHNGSYHLYYQYNPVGTDWGNMSWGHAVSRDLVHWEDRDPVLFPDGSGAAFSGCALPMEDHIRFFYTRAGEKLVQEIAESEDGEALIRKGVFLPHEVAQNRDPNVFPYGDGYLMSLFLDEHTFGIYRSNDSLRWQKLQEIDLPPLFECPAFFPLTAEDGKEKWIFWGAGGDYYVGRLEDGRFVPEQEVQKAYLDYGEHFLYAAQLVAGVTDRTLMMTWMWLPKEGSYTGGMALPTELSLDMIGGKYSLSFAPAREITNRRVSCEVLPDAPYEVCLTLNEDAYLELGALRIEGRTVTVGDKIRRIPEEAEELRLVVDCRCAEGFMKGTYLALPLSDSDELTVRGDYAFFVL